MKYKYMIVSLDPDANVERTLSNMTANGWQFKALVPTIVMHGQGASRTIAFHGERMIFEKPDPDGMADSELEALATIVRVQLMNHEIQASMAAQHGDYMPFYSAQYEILLQELRRRGVFE